MLYSLKSSMLFNEQYLNLSSCGFSLKVVFYIVTTSFDSVFAFSFCSKKVSWKLNAFTQPRRADNFHLRSFSFPTFSKLRDFLFMFQHNCRRRQLVRNVCARPTAELRKSSSYFSSLKPLLVVRKSFALLAFIFRELIFQARNQMKDKTLKTKIFIRLKVLNQFWNIFCVRSLFTAPVNSA